MNEREKEGSAAQKREGKLPKYRPIVVQIYKSGLLHFPKEIIKKHSCYYYLGKSTRIPLDVCLFTIMPLKVPNLPIYPYVQKNTLYKVNIHSNVQAIFTKLPFKQKILYLVIIWVVFLSFLVHIQASLYVCLVICSNNGAYAPFKISSYGPITMRLCGEHGWSHL